MKKLVSKMMVMFLVGLMTMGCAVTAFADTSVDTSKKGSISLTKYDISTVEQDGEGNITSGESVAGATFSAYRILDFDGKTYTVNASFVDDQGQAQVEVSDIVNTSASQAGTLSYGSTDELQAQISGLQSYIADENIAATAAAVTGTDGKLTLSNLELGVYLVQETSVPEGYTVSTQAFLVAIPSWDQEAQDGAGEWIYDISAKPKNEYLKVDKTIKDEKQGTQENGTDEDSYSIGDVVPFTVTAKVPNYGKSVAYPDLTVTDNLLLHDENGIAKYNALKLEFTDTLDKGLTLDLSSLKVTILKADGSTETELVKGDTLAELTAVTTTGEGDNISISGKTTAAGKDYTASKTANADGSTAMAIEIAWNSVDQYQGQTIQLTYEAQLNEDAIVGDANKNTVEYKFSNDPQKATGEADDPTRTGSTDENKVYIYEMDLTKKFNGQNASAAKVDASKVEFELYVKNADGTTTPLNVIETADGTYVIWTGEAAQGAATTLNPSEAGSLVVKGFEAGIYELKETKSVSGYTVLAEPVDILVEEVKEGDPEVVTGTVSASTLKYSDTGTAEKADTLADENAEGKFTITINNAMNQFDLPFVGGSGIWMFTIVGAALMAISIIIYAGLHKKSVKA